MVLHSAPALPSAQATAWKIFPLSQEVAQIFAGDDAVGEAEIIDIEFPGKFRVKV